MSVWTRSRTARTVAVLRGASNPALSAARSVAPTGVLAGTLDPVVQALRGGVPGHMHWRSATMATRSAAKDGSALPATPDTYLALRASPYELRALPVDSFEALIADAGRTSLAGLVGNIVTDVLGHRAAEAQSPRQDRLLLALLRMGQQHAQRLPLAPNVVIRLAVELLGGPDLPRLASAEINNSPESSMSGSATHAEYQTPALEAHPGPIPASVALYVLRMILTLPPTAEYHQMILPLVQLLTRTTTYPFVEEGLHVVEYLLAHGSADANQIMGVVSSISQVDGERLGEQTLRQAQADGLAWHRWARLRSGLTQVRDVRSDVGDPLHVAALRITLWSLCCRVWLRINRTRRFRAAFAGLERELAQADAFALHEAGLDPLEDGGVPADSDGTDASPRDAILQRLLQVHVQNLAGQNTRNAERAAVHTLQTCSPRLVAGMEPVVLAALCRTAIQVHEPRDAARAVRIAVQALDQVNAPLKQRMTLVHTLGAPILVEVLCVLPRESMHKLLDWLVRAVGAEHPTDTAVLDALSGLFPLPLRGRVLQCMAQAEQADLARALYVRWADSLGRPMLAEEVAALDRPWVSSPVTRPGVKPTLPDSPSRMLPPAAVLALVKLFGRQPRRGANTAVHDHTFARTVRDDYLRSLYRPGHTRSHFELTTLAHSSFLIGDVRIGMQACGEMLYRRHAADSTDIAVLLGGLADVHPDAAVSVFLRSVHSIPDRKCPALQPNAHIYAVLMSRCVRAGRMDLARRLHRDAVSRKLGSALATCAPELLLSISNERPRAYVARVQQMLREGWTPRTRLLNWVIRSAARGLSLQEAGNQSTRADPRSAAVSASPARGTMGPEHADVLAAAALFNTVATRFDHVDLPTARLLLYRFATQGRRRRKLDGRWTSALDGIVGALRWARHLTGQREYVEMISKRPAGSGFIASGDQQVEDRDPIASLHVSGAHAPETNSANCGDSPHSAGSVDRRPNAVPAPMLRQVLLAYRALSDRYGVQETLAWMSPSADKESAPWIQELARENGMLAEGATRRTTKPWWAPPKADRLAHGA